MYAVFSSWCPQVFKPSQGDPGRGGALEVSQTQERVSGSVQADFSALSSEMVRCCSPPPPPVQLPTDCPLDIACVSVIYR